MHHAAAAGRRQTIERLLAYEIDALKQDPLRQSERYDSLLDSLRVLRGIARGAITVLGEQGPTGTTDDIGSHMDYLVSLRAAVSALPAGQTLAGLALGMRPRQTFFLVLLPQAWRAALPPVTSQLINLAKNASLGVAVGYPDLVSIAGTTLNQTGRAVECLSIVIAVYLCLSLAGAALSRRLERAALRETT